MSNYRTDDVRTLARAFKALSNPHRLRIFMRLASCCPGTTRWSAQEACACVGELGGDLGIAPSTVSHHIKELHHAGLIRLERRGQNVDCQLEPGALRMLTEFFEHQACPPTRETA